MWEGGGGGGGGGRTFKEEEKKPSSGNECQIWQKPGLVSLLHPLLSCVCERAESNSEVPRQEKRTIHPSPRVIFRAHFQSADFTRQKLNLGYVSELHTKQGLSRCWACVQTEKKAF